MPALQLEQTHAPVCEAYVPALQLVQVVAPVSEAYAPVEQLEQTFVDTHAPETMAKPALHVIGHELGALSVPAPVNAALAGSMHVESCPHPAKQFQLDCGLSLVPLEDTKTHDPDA